MHNNNNNSHYDIAIVGGGLAGLSLAIQSADKGYQTLLLEKEEYPFHKVCGEYISHESYSFLQRLGVDLPALSLPHIGRLTISDGRGRAYHFPLDLGGFGISRYYLDGLLYQIALAKGVAVFTHTKATDITRSNNQFTVLSTGASYTAKVVCGTWGKRSNLDIQGKRSFAQQKPNRLNQYIGIKYHIRYPQRKDEIALHNFRDGYCGISSIEDDKCCLCYLTTAANLKRHNNSIADMERQLLSQNPWLKDIFGSATFLYKHPLAISQVSFAPKKQVENGVLMVGDTAGLITPLCGNGMSMAMHASQMAFTQIDALLQGNISRSEMEDKYSRQWKKEFARRLLIGRLIQPLLGGTTATAAFLKTMEWLPALSRSVIRATHGQSF